MSDTSQIGAAAFSVRMMFILSPEEINNAFSAMLGRTMKARLPATVLVLVLLPLAGLALLGGGRVDVAHVVEFVLVCVAAVLLLFAPKLLGRLMAGSSRRTSPDLTSPMFVELSPAGLTVQTATSTVTHSWQRYPVRAETKGLILLLTAPGRNAVAQILPWRAVAEADRPVLAALLDHNTRLVS